MSYRNYILAAVSIAVVFAGCSCPNAPPSFVSPTDADSVRSLCAEGRYHAAFRLVDKLLKDPGLQEEGAAQYEVSILLSATGGFGKSQWADIFEDPEISVEVRQSLFDEIIAANPSRVRAGDADVQLLQR